MISVINFIEFIEYPILICINQLKINSMKSINLFIGVTVSVMVMSCAEVREKTAEELLENPKMEDEIYSAILASKAHSEKFLDRMMNDENCKAMMMKNSSMVKMMCSSDKMDSLMHHDLQMMESMTNNLMNIVERDSIVCDKTCSKMMESDRFRKRIMEHIKDHHLKVPAKDGSK